MPFLKQKDVETSKRDSCTIQRSVSVVWFYLAVFGSFPLESRPLTQNLLPEENKICVQRSEDICCWSQNVESCIITFVSLPSCPSSLAPAGRLSSWSSSSSVTVVSWSCRVVSVRLTNVISDCSRIPFSPAASWTHKFYKKTFHRIICHSSSLLVTTFSCSMKEQHGLKWMSKEENTISPSSLTQERHSSGSHSAQTHWKAPLAATRSLQVHRHTLLDLTDSEPSAPHHDGGSGRWRAGSRTDLRRGKSSHSWPAARLSDAQETIRTQKRHRGLQETRERCWLAAPRGIQAHCVEAGETSWRRLRSRCVWPQPAEGGTSRSRETLKRRSHMKHSVVRFVTQQEVQGKNQTAALK